MTEATIQDKQVIISILTDAFLDNKSVNYIVKQGAGKEIRIKRLMEYSFKMCKLFGKVFILEDKNACALILYPERKKTTLQTMLLDLKLIVTCTGFNNVMKVMRRETDIKRIQPKGNICYLWFIGVAGNNQGKGYGTKLLQEIISNCKSEQRTLILETSTDRNVPWYKASGFTLYDRLDFGYTLYCMKHE